METPTPDPWWATPGAPEFDPGEAPPGMLQSAWDEYVRRSILAWRNKPFQDERDNREIVRLKSMHGSKLMIT